MPVLQAKALRCTGSIFQVESDTCASSEMPSTDVPRRPSETASALANACRLNTAADTGGFESLRQELNLLACAASVVEMGSENGQSSAADGITDIADNVGLLLWEVVDCAAVLDAG